MTAVIADAPDHVPIARPRAFAGVICGDQGETARCREGPADTLQRTSGDQNLDVRCQRADDGGERERRDPAAEHQTPPEDIAERSADQNERRKKERVTFDDPLRVRGACVKFAL